MKYEGNLIFHISIDGGIYMRKRFGRKLRESIAMIIVVAVILLVIWGMSHIPVGVIIIWLEKNWWPTLVGFAIATVGNCIVALFFGDD